ncbi:MAG: lactonase family protein [Kiritimatiellae bacterium]|nr:lactonase family protein [Kiritimatiellia bacterium]MDD5522378.1 lactonase family protein [Kiritimatiellia bacterium]
MRISSGLSLRNYFLSFISVYALLVFVFAPFIQAAEKSDFVYFGTYTRKGLSKGIYVARFDSSTGTLTKPELAGETTNPSFVAVHPTHRYLYAIGEISQFDGKKAGAVSAFKIDPTTGKLTLLNQVASKGTGPCHVFVDKTGKYALVANYGGGSAAAFAIKEDGNLGESTGFVQHEGSGPDQRRQKGPHAHSINLSPDNRFAVVADLGLDKVMIYKFDQDKGTLVPNNPPFAATPPAAGPRHFAFHPSSKFAYVINEMGNTVTAFSFDSDCGAFKEVQTISTLPAGFTNTSHTAEVQVHPSGKFVYGSNRGHDSIALFSVDQATGKLTYIETTSVKGKIPRNFGIHPSGNWLIAANQDSNNIVVFKVDATTGKLTPTGQEFEVGTPVCVKFMTAE